MMTRFRFRRRTPTLGRAAGSFAACALGLLTLGVRPALAQTEDGEQTVKPQRTAPGVEGGNLTFAPGGLVAVRNGKVDRGPNAPGDPANPANPGRSADPARAGLTRRADTKLTLPLAVEWKYTGNPFPNNPAMPVIAEDTAYFASGARIYAVDLQTGGLKWRYPSEANLGTVVQTTPAVSNGALYFGAGDGLYALSTTDGKQKWHYTLNNGVNTSPVVLDNTVYFSAGNGRFYAVDTATGKAAQSAWNRDTRGGTRREGLEIGDLGADYGVGDGLMFYVTTNQVLHAVDLATAVQKWAQRLDFAVPNAKPVVNGESLYLASSSTLSCFRTSNGARRWLITLPRDTTAPPAFDADGNVYVITADRSIYSVDTRGRFRWRQVPHVDYEAFTQPIVAGDALIVGTGQGGIYAFDTATGALKWTYVVQPSGVNANAIPTSATVAAQPVVANNALYVLSDDGSLTAFRHDAPDSLPPTILVREPTPGDYINGRPPFRISAQIMDEGSGLNLDSLVLSLDDVKLPRRALENVLSTKAGFVFDPNDGAIDYSTLEGEGGSAATLADGHHTITISVKDWMGNKATKSWTFSTDDTLPRRARRGTVPAGGAGGGSKNGPTKGG